MHIMQYTYSKKQRNKMSCILLNAFLFKKSAS